MHIEAQSKKISKSIALLRRAKPFVPQHIPVKMYNTLVLPYFTYCSTVWNDGSSTILSKLSKLQRRAAGASILGGWGGTRPLQFLDWGDEYLIVPPPIFSYVHAMKFNSTLFTVYCGHCLSLSILFNIIQIQTRSHMLTQSCFFSNFLRCY